mgnify:CR=1 FL=1
MKRFLVIPVLLVAFACAEAQSAAPISYSVAPDMNVTLKNVSGKLHRCPHGRHRGHSGHESLTDMISSPSRCSLIQTRLIDNVVDPAGDPEREAMEGEHRLVPVHGWLTMGRSVTRGKVMLDMRQEALTYVRFPSHQLRTRMFGSILDKVTASASRDRGSVDRDGTTCSGRPWQAREPRPCGTLLPGGWRMCRRDEGWLC